MKPLYCTSTCVAIILLVLLNGWFQWVGGCFEDERRALLLIRDSVPSYNESYLLPTWKGEDCCEWDGITCSDSTRHVVGIVLYDVDLPKFVNYTLFAAFKELQDLWLDYVRMNGGDQILNVTCKLKHLRSLRFYGPSINNSIPTCLCDNDLLATLQLINIQLKGIPSCLRNMKSLQYLDISDNQLKGGIPSCLCNMKSLQTLHLYGNQLEGSIPSCLCNMKSLQSLHLSGNLLEGSIPSCLCNMKDLQILSLSGNQLDGEIPSCLGNMKSLITLDLSSNQLTGNIPHSIFPNLTTMVIFEMSNNQFSGVFSFSILANLSMLGVVDLSNNVQLEVDTESPTWVPSFQLVSLYLANCNLNKQTGSIPSFISSQHHLENLDLSHNSLEGKIPYSLLYNTSSVIIAGNKLVGPLPSPPVKNMSARVQWLDMSDNGVGGPLSANKDFFLSSSLEFLNMSSNGLDGEIPESMNFMKNQLRALDLSNNNLSGEIPYWLAANNSVLQLLILSNNKFQGEVLQEGSNMTELLALHLDGNSFTGSIPTSLVNSPNLMILDIGDNNMSGDLSDLFPMPSQLRALIFRRNNLQGHIPRHLCLLQQLQYLDLSGNHFSGDIPSCFANITSMMKENYEPLQGYLNEGVLIISVLIPIFHGEVNIKIGIEIHFNTKRASYIFKGKPEVVMNGIDFSFNQLTGSIPAEIGYLKGLHSLNLSHNSLIGPIPLSFRYMKSLECLDLSYNHINGTIPLEMAGLDSLAVLNVSFNNLSGEIPSYGHFLTLNDPASFMGNPGLCGRELERHCSSDNDKPSISLDNDDRDENSSIMDSSLAFYSSVAISYILGFWGVIALLIFKKNWRYKFFKFADVLLEGCYDKLWAIHFYLKNSFQSC